MEIDPNIITEHLKKLTGLEWEVQRRSKNPSYTILHSKSVTYYQFPASAGGTCDHIKYPTTDLSKNQFLEIVEKTSKLGIKIHRFDDIWDKNIKYAWFFTNLRNGRRIMTDTQYLTKKLGL